MKKNLLLLTTAIILLGLSGFAWGQDPGVPDTFHVICYDSCHVSPPPWEVHFTLLVTHDVPNPAQDSLAGVILAFDITHTNPTAYCSISYWKNHTMLSSDIANSVFRHFGGMQNRMMNLYEQGNGAEWDCRFVYVQTEPPAHFRFAVAACQLDDQRWWEGSSVLLATMTFIVSDTMTIHIENGPWPPPGGIVPPTFGAGVYPTYTYYPQHNLPYSVKIRSGQRGDVNGDRVIDLGDVLHLVSYLYKNGPAPDPLEAGDVDFDGDIDLGDLLYLVNYLYKGGPPPGCP
ncbi:MAG: hypothetical protein AMJ91_03230 [candidate division Zixibacteria bacterium SM23_73_3]|nr:MAG: hypothetical protein AMJ91_03230 [candidate division Zixibacteria bacterium SM23_73_3]